MSFLPEIVVLNCSGIGCSTMSSPSWVRNVWSQKQSFQEKTYRNHNVHLAGFGWYNLNSNWFLRISVSWSLTYWWYKCWAFFTLLLYSLQKVKCCCTYLVDKHLAPVCLFNRDCVDFSKHLRWYTWYYPFEHMKFLGFLIGTWHDMTHL